MSRNLSLILTLENKIYIAGHSDIYFSASTPTSHVTLQQYEPQMVIDSTSAHQINQALAYINGLGPTLGQFWKLLGLCQRLTLSTRSEPDIKRVKIFKIIIQSNILIQALLRICKGRVRCHSIITNDSCVDISLLPSHFKATLIFCLEYQIHRLLQHFTHLHQNYSTTTNHWYTQTGKWNVLIWLQTSWLQIWVIWRWNQA